MGYQDAFNKLAKWRSVFAGWQLGTRPKGDAESDAVRDHREVTILLRAEVNALTALLVDKKVATAAEIEAAFTKEAKLLDADYECRFPGFKSEPHGISMQLPEAASTMRRMNWKP